jgi:hypothetical protein
VASDSKILAGKGGGSNHFQESPTFIEIQERLRSKNLILLVGTGCSMASTAAGNNLSWPNLILSGLNLAQDENVALPAGWFDLARGDLELGRQGHLESLLVAAEKMTYALGEKPSGLFRRWLRSRFGDLEVNNDSVPRAILGLGAPVLTTNYDDVLHLTGRFPVCWTDSVGIQAIVQGIDSSIGHLHGHWRNPESIVLGIRSYESILGNGPIQALQSAVASMKSFLFIGFGDGLSDPNIGALRKLLSKNLKGSEVRHYRFCVTSQLESLSGVHMQENIIPVAYGDLHDDLASSLNSLGSLG